MLNIIKVNVLSCVCFFLPKRHSPFCCLPHFQRYENLHCTRYFQDNKNTKFVDIHNITWTLCRYSNSDKHVHSTFTLKTPSLSLSSYYLQDVAIKDSPGELFITVLSALRPVMWPFFTVDELDWAWNEQVLCFSEILLYTTLLYWKHLSES